MLDGIITLVDSKNIHKSLNEQEVTWEQIAFSNVILLNKTDLIPKNELIEYKEALIFALLGFLKLCDRVNCLSSVTGAKKDHSSGVVFLPEKQLSNT